jgi:hypothetical protein
VGIDESAFFAIKRQALILSDPERRVCFAVATLLLLSSPHHRGSENMGASTLKTVAPRESVAFSFKVPNLSLKSFALPFSVF